MKRKPFFAALLAGAILLGLLAGCGQADAPSTQQPADPPAATDEPTPDPTATPEPEGPALEDYEYYNKDYNPGFVYNASDLTDYKKNAASQQGTVVALEYETPAYAVNDIFGVDETLTKTMNIYLPYGYDEAKQYNILYLLHGTEGSADEVMEDYWLVQSRKTTCNVLENMIEKGQCDPVIIVCPSYYSRVEGYEITNDQMKALGEKLNDSYMAPDSAEDGGDPDNQQNVWPVYFGQELRNNIIPAVESVYSTYAGKDVSEASLIASRDHRAFAGLSRGAMTVARSGMISNADLFAYFGSYSGVWAEFEQFKAALEGQFKDYPIKYWYNGTGTKDFAFDNHYTFYQDAMEQMPDTFTDAENAAMVVLDGGAHNYAAWLADLYNSMLVFFQQ